MKVVRDRSKLGKLKRQIEVQEHNHHILLLQIGNTLCKLLGRRLKHGALYCTFHFNMKIKNTSNDIVCICMFNFVLPSFFVKGCWSDTVLLCQGLSFFCQELIPQCFVGCFSLYIFCIGFVK